MLIALVLVFSCEQEVLVPQAPEPEEPPTGTSGSANFTKFVSIGNSLTAGFMAGALFDFGQQNSFPAIMAEHFEYVSDNDAFDQPLTGSINGCSNPPSCTLGRLILFDADGPGPGTPRPTPAGSPGVPAPYNTNAADHGKSLAPYTGSKANLNNFGVPGIVLAHLNAPQAGDISNPSHPLFNPYYARFASNPGTSTILGDALATNPTFISFWVGNNDVLGYAVGGASNPAILTSVATFSALFNGAMDAILANPNRRAVVGNIPNVTAIPYFRVVPHNPVPLDATTASTLNSAFAGYNAALDALKAPAFGGAFGTAAELDARKISFSASTSNRVVIQDESLINLAPGFDALLAANLITPAQRAALAPYERARQATSNDRLVLTAASFIGTLVGGNPQLINGVTVPLADQWVLIPSEITEITNRINDFNNVISTRVNAESRLALANINSAFTALASSPGQIVDGIFINAFFAPPGGIFSEDGIHPNPRGAAYVAKIFIQAINSKFGSTVPLPNISKYYGTYFPVSP
ncbi:MAG: hypothetical protein NZM13_07955 [Cyclobacteriaceae bacterium]|nr:hypothetical protein [Cyclobacteriaceae bacterium]